jgi:uncharacterized protein (TIGR02145 family)
MNKTENKTEGLTLYTLQSNYSGDTTKNCGLIGGEIDANFLFLRGNDIYSGEINEENNTLILKKGNENSITIPNIRKDTRITGGYINNVTGELVLETNGDDIVITGFTSSSFFTDITIHGDGSTNNPIRLSELYKSPYLPSVKTVIDLTNNGIITDEYKIVGTYIITKEYDNSDGLLYNFNGVKEIESILKENNSNWRVPTFEDWGQMLNALEICDDRNHLFLKNDYFGKFAGAYLKNDGLGWIEKIETSYSYGFKANACGFKTSKDDTDSNYGHKTRFWTSDINEYEEIWVKELDKKENRVKTVAGDKEGFYSLRLVKDYENVDLVNEKILENNYDIIKMPYVIIDAENNVTQRGYRVWTSVNINFSGISENNYTEVNNNIETKTPLFYLNYWNGSNWVKRLIEENDVVTIEDVDNKEYKLLNNELVVYHTGNGGGVDDVLSNYYTKLEVSQKFQEKGDYASKSDIKDFITSDNLKTINGETIVGHGDITIKSGDVAPSDYYVKQEIDAFLNSKQNILISGTNIKTINNNSILGLGNLNINDNSGEISNLKSQISELQKEITYIKKFISHYSGIDIINNNYSDEIIKTLDTSLNSLQSDTNELSITKKDYTAFIDLSKENLGGVMMLQK